MLAQENDWEHGNILRETPDEQQLPGVHIGDVLDHHITEDD